MIILLKIPFRATFAVIWPHGTVISLWRLTKLYDGHRRALRGRILLCVILALKQKMHFAKNVIYTITHIFYFKKIAQSMVKRNAIYLVTEAVILSKQLKGKYELLLPAQICFFFREI